MIKIAVCDDEPYMLDQLAVWLETSLGDLGCREAVLRRFSSGQALLEAEEDFDLVFLDPPYALVPSEVLGFMGRLREAGLLAPAAIVSYEHDGADDDTVEALAAAQGWRIFSHRRFGDTAIDLMELA